MERFYLNIFSLKNRNQNENVKRMQKENKKVEINFRNKYFLAKLNKRHRESFRKERKFLIKVYKFFLSTEFETEIKKTKRKMKKKKFNFAKKKQHFVYIDDGKLLCAVFPLAMAKTNTQRTKVL